MKNWNFESFLVMFICFPQNHGKTPYDILHKIEKHYYNASMMLTELFYIFIDINLLIWRSYFVNKALNKWKFCGSIYIYISVKEGKTWFNQID